MKPILQTRKIGTKLWAAILIVITAIVSFICEWFLKPISTLKHVTVSMDFVVSGYHVPFLIALDKEYYVEEGLSVTVKRGFGASRVITELAGGP